MVSATKRSEHAAKHSAHNQVKVVTKHRLADGHHSTVFPQHAGESHWHGGPRNGHPGSHEAKATMKK